MSYSYKTDGLVLNAPHCLPLYSFRICHHLLEGIKFQVFVSRSPSSRFVTMAFRFSNSLQVLTFTSSRRSFLPLSFSPPVCPTSPMLPIPIFSAPLFLTSANPGTWMTCSTQSVGSSDSLVLISCLKTDFVNLFDPWGKSDGAQEFNSSPNPSPLTASKYLCWPFQVFFSFHLVLQALFCWSL